MGDKLPTIWEIAPHTQMKHFLLKRYLGAWYAIIGKYNQRAVFMDGFAGPGVYKGGEDGSPIIALKSLLDHQHNLASTKFVLILGEVEKERFQSLEKVVNQLKGSGWPSHVQVMLYNRQFSDVAQEIIDRLEKIGASLAPTLAFLDPFGYRDIPLDLIVRLLSFERCELFVYFDVNSVVRFANAGNVDKHLNALFGTDEYLAAPPAGSGLRKQYMHDLYQRQLTEVAGFPYVQSFEMINGTGRTGYYLFFCTRNLRGFDAMKEAMWKAAPDGGFRFSDRLHGQEVLFGEDDSVSQLRHELMREFKGKTVPIKQIEDFVVAKTPYYSGHIKKRTLAPMQREGLITSPNQARKNTYPDGTLVTFL